MTQNTELVKKTSGRSIFKKLFLSILVFMIVIIIASAALFIYLKTAKTTKDDIAVIISTETIPVSERYSCDASTKKLEISIDKSDLWYILEKYNYEDTIKELADDLKSNGFILQSYGLDITDKGILISAEITYGNSLRLPLKILMNTTFKDGSLIISPAKLYLGKIRLWLDKFPLNWLLTRFGVDSDFDLNEYAYKISLSDSKLMSMLTDINFKHKRMAMVYKLDESLFSSSVSAYKRDLDWFAGNCTNCIEVLSEYSRKGALGERFTSLVNGFVSNPDSFPDFVAESLAVANVSESKEYLRINGPWLARLMPGITEKSISDSHTSFYKLCNERSSLFDKLLVTLLASYNSLEFGIDERGLTYNNKPFNLESFMGDNWKKYSSWLDASSFRPVLVDTISAEDTKTPFLKKITNSTKYLDNVSSLNKKIPLGFIVKMQDGTPVLKYLDVVLTGRDKAITGNQEVVLDNTKYESMMKNPMMPVWRN